VTDAEDRSERLAAISRANAAGRDAGLVEGACWALEIIARQRGELGLPDHVVDVVIDKLARWVGDVRLVAGELKRRGFANQARRLLEGERLAEGARPPDQNSPEGVGAKGDPGGWTGGRP
jgi:hypothetical protein